ncbi:hypothetical protein GIY62_06090 [Burkholderia plantarii]|uniref:hypothetical protein n=1 Tax=Burkholderia plantarii TaxID=41899 RepID=UPI00272DBA8D|nr:hypothetical protein [Burkholderia plantarii]WLE60227.1 hypothetical protein GIY62_06090 [Burkholderia plantarii]
MASALPVIQQIARISTDSDLMHTAVHGTAAQKVETENGPIPTLAGALATLVGFTLRGAWSTGSQYVVKDIYTADGLAYLVIEAHVSTTVAADQTAGRVVVYQGIPPVEFSTRISRIVASVSELETLPAAGYSTVFTIGYYGAGSLGQRMYVADPSDTTTPADRGLVFQSTDGGRFKLVHHGSVTPYDFGARGDGVVGKKEGTDDTDALERMLLAWSPSLALDIAGVTFNFSRQLNKAGVNLTMKTAGAANTNFNWIGNDGTGIEDADALDLIVLGDGETECSNWDVGGFGVESAVSVKGGAAVRIRKMMKDCSLRGFQVGYVTANGNLFHGVWFDVTNVSELPSIRATKLQGSGLRVSGSETDSSASDLQLVNGNISFCKLAGVHIGGGFGGFRSGQINCYGNAINFLIDNSIVNNGNREIFLQSGTVSDGATGDAGVKIADTLVSNSIIELALTVSSSGRIGKNGPAHGIWIESWANGSIAVTSTEIYNHAGNAIQKDDPSVVVRVAPTTAIHDNDGYGIAASQPDQNIYYFCGHIARNKLGNFNENSQCANGDTFVSTPTSSAGPLGNATATTIWSKNGKIAMWETYLTITSNATGAGSIAIPMPFTVRGAVVVNGKEIAKTGKALTGFINANSSVEGVTYSDNSYPGGDGVTMVLSGTAEVQ